MGLGEVIKIDRVINNDEKEVGLSKEIAVLMKQKLCVDVLPKEKKNERPQHRVVRKRGEEEENNKRGAAIGQKVCNID